MTFAAPGLDAASHDRDAGSRVWIDAERAARFAAPHWLERGAVPTLDGLRALAVLLVMTAHSGLETLVPGGFGVTLFFFISGFLITTLMLREWRAEGQARIGAFYGRRILRLYPPLLAYLLAAVAARLVSSQPIDAVGLLGALFYGGNYLVALAPARIEPLGVHLWSLAVEEHFYLLYPLVFAALARARRPLKILAVCCALALATRFGHAWAGSPESYVIVATETRFDSILFGAFLAFAVASPQARPRLEVLTRPATLTAAALLLLSTFVIRDPLFRTTLRYSLQGVALIAIFSALLFADPKSMARRALDARAARWIGALSYGLYLWHSAIFALVAAALATWAPAPVVVALGWAGAFAAAWAVYMLVETPLFALRRRFGSHVKALR